MVKVLKAESENGSPQVEPPRQNTVQGAKRQGGGLYFLYVVIN